MDQGAAQGTRSDRVLLRGWKELDRARAGHACRPRKHRLRGPGSLFARAGATDRGAVRQCVSFEEVEGTPSAGISRLEFPTSPTPRSDGFGRRDGPEGQWKLAGGRARNERHHRITTSYECAPAG